MTIQRAKQKTIRYVQGTVTQTVTTSFLL